jgi:hypothetical protein
VTAYKLHEKASKSSTRKTRSAFHAGLRRVGNTKRIANEIGFISRLKRVGRPAEVSALVSSGIYKLATTVNGANTKGKDSSLHLAADNVYVGM